jgi:deoxycytidylate deaminase
MSGRCAKRHVEATLITASGRMYHGTNACENPQVRCPREVGEGYEKCKSICQQGAHAEINALNAAVAAEGTYVAIDADVVVYGHYYGCEHCSRTLAEAGVRRITIQVTP